MNTHTWLWIVIVIGLLVLVFYRFLPKRFRPRSGEMTAQSVDPSFDRRVMAVLVSLTVGGAALYMILSKQYAGESEKWAFGVVGTVVGFWLRPEKD